MNEKDKTEIIKRYDGRLKKFGITAETLSVGNEVRRNIRYQVLTEIGNLEGKKILDLGCGFGDLIGFLRDKDINCDYTGYDINPKLIEIARKKNPSYKFEVVDIFIESFPKFDYILSSSSFNNKLKFEDNNKFIEKILKVSYEHAVEGVAIDFLTSYVDFKKDHTYIYHHKPEKIFSIAKKFTRRVCLRHDYPLFEFCVYLFKDIKFPY